MLVSERLSSCEVGLNIDDLDLFSIYMYTFRRGTQLMQYSDRNEFRSGSGKEPSLVLTSMD